MHIVAMQGRHIDDWTRAGRRLSIHVSCAVMKPKSSRTNGRKQKQRPALGQDVADVAVSESSASFIHFSKYAAINAAIGSCIIVS
jgi:hypothetical protein